MKHVITSAAAALATATLVLGAAGTAQAESTSVDDGRADVWKKPTDRRGHWSEAGSALNGDIDETVVDHGTDTITLTTTYRRLEKKKVAFEPYYVIRTDAGAEYLAYVIAGPRMWGGEHDFFESSAPTVARHLRGVPPTEEPGCADMTHRISYRDDTVTTEIPRSCVGDATWVKVKSLSASFRRHSDKVWIDNGHVAGHTFKGWTGQLDAEVPPVA